MRGRRFELPIDAAKYWKHNRIVWVGPSRPPKNILQLVKQLHGALKDEGFVLEERPFAAHVTLVRKSGVPRALPPLPGVAWPADEFVLVRSITGGTGSRYEVVERFSLGR